MNEAITLALTGASGAPYALRLLQCLVQADYRVYLLASSAARVVLKTEQQQEWPGSPKELSVYLCRQYGAKEGQIVACGKEEWFSPVASGSARAQTDGGLPLLHGHRLGHCQRHLRQPA